MDMGSIQSPRPLIFFERFTFLFSLILCALILIAGFIYRNFVGGKDYSPDLLTILYLCASYSFGKVISDVISSFKLLKNTSHTMSCAKYAKNIYIYSFSGELVIFVICLFIRIAFIVNTDVTFLYVAIASTLASFLYNTYYEMSSSEKNELCESNKLNIGYAAAIMYYNNFLAYFVPYLYEENIEKFCESQLIEVPKKLFVLLPKTCKTMRNLDEIDRFERARELPPYTMDIAGVKDREYKITVYEVKKNTSKESVWCAAEYAQPLNDLLDMKKNGKITEKECAHERKVFIETLKILLDDHKESFKTMILIPYDDTNEKIKVADLVLDAYYASSK